MSFATDMQQAFNKLNNKTIETVEVQGVNSVVLHMTDGTDFTLEPECVFPTLQLYRINLVEGMVEYPEMEPA